MWEIKETKEKSKFAEDWREIWDGNTPIVSTASFDRDCGEERYTVSGVKISRENAEFIIKACNSHNALITMLKKLQKEMYGPTDNLQAYEELDQELKALLLSVD